MKHIDGGGLTRTDFKIFQHNTTNKWIVRCLPCQVDTIWHGATHFGQHFQTYKHQSNTSVVIIPAPPRKAKEEITKTVKKPKTSLNCLLEQVVSRSLTLDKLQAMVDRITEQHISQAVQDALEN